MKIRYAAKTDVGMKRTHNEDYFSLIEDEQLFIVADGMGGHASGEVASKMAADTIGEFYQRTQGRRRDLALQDGPPALVHREPAGLRHQARQPAHLRDQQPRPSLQGHGHDDRLVAWSSATRSTSATSATRAAIACAAAASSS